ncbi:MAG: 16S rRNA (guanine(966)-N(2))-methyltransferase RsmD [Hyphomicrobiales bacterium]|nr:16S rRNA (guanine(966)-N(2))-methyltransferase RsmD [Hyphomicrobiales bacterium]
MRIVGGRFGGRSLKGPSSQAIRPTSDRLRESLFNILAHGYGNAVEDARVIDLFAGTGALGLEAVSRGAKFALFVDEGAEARALLRENVLNLGLGGQTRIFRRDATKLGDAPIGDKFTLAFLDPPYDKGLGPRALKSLIDGDWLAPGALIVVEESTDALIEPPPQIEALDLRSYGDTQIMIARRVGAEVSRSAT